MRDTRRPTRTYLPGQLRPLEARRLLSTSTSVVRIIDDADPGFNAAGGYGGPGGNQWVNWAGGLGYLGDHSTLQVGSGVTKAATWSFTNLPQGRYRIQTTWVSDPNRAIDAPYRVSTGGTSWGVVPIDQTKRPDQPIDGGLWRDLGLIVDVAQGDLTVSLTPQGSNPNWSGPFHVVADAVRVERVGDLPNNTPTGPLLDDGGIGYTSTAGWQSYGPGGYAGDHSAAVARSWDGSEAATWSFTGVVPGAYRVYTTWVPANNRAVDAPFSVFDGSTGLGTVRLDQTLPPSSQVTPDAAWQDLGRTFVVNSGVLKVTLNNNASNPSVPSWNPTYVVADAVRILRVETSPNTTIVDNGGSNFSTTGPWTSSSFGRGYNGDYLQAAMGDGSSKATWTFRGLNPGVYTIHGTWDVPGARSTSAPFSVFDGQEPIGTSYIDQSAPFDFYDQGVGWKRIGLTFEITTTEARVVLSNKASNAVVTADAIRLERVSDLTPRNPSVVIDLGQTTSNSSATSGFVRYAGGYLDTHFAAAPATGSSNPQTATWTFTALQQGRYRVFATWVAAGNRATNAPFSVETTGTSETVRLDQTRAPITLIRGTYWQDFGNDYLVTGNQLKVTLSNTAANGYVIADAVRLERVGDLPTTSLPNIVIADDNDTGFTTVAPWDVYRGSGAFGDHSAKLVGTPGASATWTASLRPGKYRVWVSYVQANNRDPRAVYTLSDGRSVLVDQRVGPPTAIDGVAWTLLDGTTDFTTGTGGVTLTGTTPGTYIIADAVRFERVGEPGPTPAPIQTSDDGSAWSSTVGTWETFRDKGFEGDHSATKVGSGNSSTAWTFPSLTPGRYRIWATWIPAENRAIDAPYNYYEGGNWLARTEVDQRRAPTELIDGTFWTYLWTLNLSSNLTVRLTNSASLNSPWWIPTYVVADGIRIERVGDLTVGGIQAQTLAGPESAAVAKDSATTATAKAAKAAKPTRITAKPAATHPQGPLAQLAKDPKSLRKVRSGMKR